MKFSKLVILLIISLLVGSSLQAQQKRSMAKSRHQNMFGRELLSYRYYNYADSTDEKLSLMEFHVGVVNDVLTFLKTDSGSYKARYEILVIIFNERDEAIVEKSATHRVTVETFAETNSRRNPDFHILTASLRPGRYKGELQLNDFESGESLTKELELTFRDFGRDQVHWSDIKFIDKIDTTDTGVVYHPNLQHIFDDVNSAFAARVQLYLPKDGADVETSLSIYTAGNEKLFTVDKTYPTTLDVINLVIPFRQHLKNPGEYYLVAEAKQGDKLAKVQRMFSVVWGNVPLAQTNLDMAITQLSLVADKKDIEAMRAASESERKQLFDEYWEKRDPTPSSQRNELKEEFFTRIDFANRNFTEIVSGRSGWQTDRGKVYVVYGAPDNVDRRNPDINSPATETWYYNRLNRKYFFADRNGEGIFRLVKVD
jgi:GWxTD domain-containing protein